jgi:hypothetical protein
MLSFFSLQLPRVGVFYCVTSPNYPQLTFAFYSVSSLTLFHLLDSRCPRSLQRGPLSLRARLYVCPLALHYDLHCASTVTSLSLYL